jgi:DNA helicase II / ATP-dependent DNA helicase PcrA
MNIKYRIVGGLSFYQRKEIKDLLAYLRFSVNHNDEQALKRIINFPKRGIGEATINKVVVYAYEQGISLWEVLMNINRLMGGKQVTSILEFVTLIKKFSMEIARKDAFESASLIAKESGILKELYEDKTIEGLSRYENIQELLNAVKEFVDDEEKEDKSLSSFLQEVSLITSIEEDEENEEEKVTLMTIHMAKGLEFRYVYLVGLEEDLFPSQMMLSSRADLEEERRLFYVAMTRAKEKLTLSYAFTRYRFGRLKSCDPSRFLQDVDPRFIASRGSAGIETIAVPGQPERPRKLSNSLTLDPPALRSVKPHVPSQDFHESDTVNLGPGMSVEHPKFGFGKVVNIEMDGAERKAKVNFDNFGVKTLLLSFAKLRICD